MKPINALLDRAVDRTSEQFSQLLSDTLMTNAALRHRVSKGYDRKGGYSVKQSLTEVDQELAFLRSVSVQVESVDSLFYTLESHVADELDHLFFVDNDLPTARMKCDALKGYIEVASAMLDAGGLLSRENKRRLETVVKGYQLGLLSYLQMREDVTNTTDGEEASLLDWAQRTLKEKQRETGEPKRVTQERVIAQAKDLYRQMLSDQGVECGPEERPMTAIYCLLKDLTEVALQQAVNDHGTIDPAEPKQAETVAHKYFALLDRVAEMQANNGTFEAMEELYDYVEKERAAAFKLPEDFQLCIANAAQKAEKAALASLPRQARTAESDQRRHWSAGRDRVGVFNMNIGTTERIERASKGMLRMASDTLVQARSYDTLVRNCDALIDRESVACMFTCDEPAQLLVLEEYLKTFKKALVSQLREREVSAMAVSEKLDTVIDKAATAYRAHWAASEWCLNFTDNKYDNFGLYALMSACHERATDFEGLSLQDRAQVPGMAMNFFETCAERLGIPEKFRLNSFVPLLYDLCAEHAIDTQERNSTGDFPPFSDRVSAKKMGLREMRQEHAVADKKMKKVNPAAMKLFTNTMEMFPLDEEGLPEVPPGQLKEALSFFDTAHARRLN